MWPAWERLIRSVPVPPRDFTRVQERRQVREAESRRRTRCRARGLARTRTRARPCAPPRPALSSTGHARGARPPAHACWLDEHGPADAWRNQTLVSRCGISRTRGGVKKPALGRYGATERRALVAATHFKVQGHAPCPPCHLTLPSLHPCPGVGSLGAHVGPLSSRCDAAALGADRAGHLRPRRYYCSLTLPSAFTPYYSGRPPGHGHRRCACAGGSRLTPGGGQVMPRARGLQLGVLGAAPLAIPAANPS